MRYNGLLARVEPQEGQRKWNAIDKLSEKIEEASSTGVN
jgi:hypothetical protein